ncbi:MAG: sigma-70 family RNA polymerase sigma factor [Acidobacteria bacterium]|nr:sigma-70 family RNA polymerase sigma factor [Acidobacteriota bacterium]
MDLYYFNAEYIRKLRDGDPQIERHFSTYFGDLIGLKLRARLQSPQLIEDIRQETLLRVLQILRRHGLEHPERFGAFVNSVCNHVFQEFCRAEGRHPVAEAVEAPDPSADLEAPLVRQDLARRIRRTLDRMPSNQRELLRTLFLEECDKAEVCRRYRVSPGYLRVLLHRAKVRFRAEYLRRRPPVP